MNIFVSVIIPTFNGIDLLKENLPSVISAIIEYKNSELIIVDDGSTDDTYEYLLILKDGYEFIKIVRNSENLGFIESIHKGVKIAKGEILIFLNSDVKIPKNFIKEIIYPFKTSDKIFAVSPLIFNNRKITSGSWKVPFLKKGEIKFKKWKNFKIYNDRFYKTLFCEAGAVAIDKEKFIKIKKFDKIYKPFYYEDTEICVRAWANGYKCVFYPKITVLHKHKSTIGKYYSKFFIKRIMRRNRFIFLWSVLPSDYLIKIHIINIFLRLVLYTIKGDFSYFLGLFSALRYLNEIRKRRDLYKDFDLRLIIKEINEDLKKLKEGKTHERDSKKEKF